MKYYLRVCAAAAALFLLAACQRPGTGSPRTVSSAETEDGASSTTQARIEDGRAAESLKDEAAQIAAHPGHAVRDNFNLTILSGGKAVAKFTDDNGDDCGYEGCDQHTYDGVFSLVDPATGLTVDYDHVDFAKSESNFEYLVDGNGLVYYAGTGEPLVSASKTALASTDQTVHGRGALEILDWKTKTNLVFPVPEVLENRGYYCIAGGWTAQDHLKALCKNTDLKSVSDVEVWRQSDGRWMMMERMRYSLADLSDDDAAGLKPGAKGIAPLKPEIRYAEPGPRGPDRTDMTG